MSIKLNNDNEKKYVTCDGNIVIDFSAEWCNPCKEFKPVFNKLATEFPDITFLTSDINEMDEFATDYDIQSLPTIIFIKAGHEVGRILGKQNYEKFKNFIINCKEKEI